MKSLVLDTHEVSVYPHLSGLELIDTIPDKELQELSESILDEISQEDSKFPIFYESDSFQFSGELTIDNWSGSYAVYPSVKISELEIIPGNDNLVVSSVEIERCKRKISAYIVHQIVITN